MLAASALAQKNELTGRIGRTFISDQGVNNVSLNTFPDGDWPDVKLWRSLKLRGEVRDFWSGTPNAGVDTGKSRQHNIDAGGGVVWQFGKR